MIGGEVTASASWSAPTTGGTPTLYVVRALAMSATGTVAVDDAVQRRGIPADLQMTLDPGKYQFTVQAQNSSGSGAQSARSGQVAAR